MAVLGAPLTRARTLMMTTECVSDRFANQASLFKVLTSHFDDVGITRETQVVLYDAHGVFSSPRFHPKTCCP